MSMRTTTAVAAMLAMALFGTGPAAAGGVEVVSCYQKTKAPVIYKTIRRRVLVDRGVYEVVRKPPLYGWRKRRVVIEPGRIVWHERPPVYRTVTRTRTVSGGYRWQKRRDCRAETICKVRAPARTVTYREKMLVKPGRRWAERQPPVYGWQEERVLLRPYRNISIYHRARYRTVTKRVAIQPEGWRWRPVSRRGCR